MEQRMSRSRSALFSLAVLLFSAQGATAAISFSSAEPYTVAARPEYMTIGDLNRDRRGDIVVVSPQSNEVNILLGDANSAQRFNPGTSLRFGKTLSQPTIGDLNADNNPDVVVPDEGAKGVWILLGRGDGTFLPPFIVNVGRNPFAVAIANFDGIQNNDLAIADRRQDRVFIRLNDGQNPPRFAVGPELTVGDSPEAIAAVDVNKDGKADIITLNVGGPRVKDVSVLLFQRVAAGFPAFDTERRYLVGENPEAFNVADLNKDNVPDLVMLNRPSGTGNSNVDVLLADGTGQFFARPGLEVPCPFFTGGLFCRARALTVGDFDGNGNTDLAIAITDPRRFSQTDAMQVFAGRGDGGFVGGAVFSIGKAPTTVVSPDLTGDGPPDLAVATKRILAVQAFLNVSTPGDKANGTECVLGDECLSGRCTNGRCCATQCFDTERCDVPGNEGVCLPVVPAEECFDDLDCESFCRNDPTRECTRNSDCASGDRCDVKTCKDEFCCDAACTISQRCDVPGFEGICIDRGEDGEDCFENADCQSGFCRDDFCCNQDCQNGACDVGGLEGLCQPRLPLGEPCQDDDECGSNVCDQFDGICCEERCDPVDEFCDVDGICTLFDEPTPTVPPNVTQSPMGVGTPIGTPTPGAAGSSCGNAQECATTFCVNNVCCFVFECNDDEHCQLGTGNCVEGTAPPTLTPTPTPVRSSTRLPSSTPVGGPCGDRCSADNCVDGVCVFSSRSGGCATGGGAEGGGNLAVVALLPVMLWMGRRWHLMFRQARARVRVGRQ